MRLTVQVLILSALIPALWPGPAFAVDETAANLVAEGKINLSQMIDTLNGKYPKDREFFWNVSGIAYHDFSGSSQADVLIGLSGYRDSGKKYNNDKQLVEDAGAGFAYFRLEGDQWKLKQVELVEGKRYEGFEGADLMGTGREQLVVYTSIGEKQLANVYAIQKNGTFGRVTSITGYGLGPRVALESGKPLIVDFQPALVNSGSEWVIYNGRPFPWDGRKFVEQKDEFLDHVQAYDPFHSTVTETTRALTFFEGYLSTHPKDFCATANCYELSNRLALKDKTDQYKKALAGLGDNSLECRYCDEWMREKNKSNAMEYLNQVLGKKSQKKSPLEKFIDSKF